MLCLCCKVSREVLCMCCVDVDKNGLTFFYCFQMMVGHIDVHMKHVP